MHTAAGCNDDLLYLQAKIAQRIEKRNQLFASYNGTNKRKVTDYIITVVTDEEVFKGLLKQVRFL